MAKRKQSRKPKFTPAERTLRFEVEHRAGFAQEQAHYLDIAKELSKVNRRLYRQHKVYSIRSISITSRNSQNSLMKFGVAPDTWVTRNALSRGKLMFDKMQKLATDNGVPKPRYNDYKVYLSNAHRNQGSFELKAIDSNGDEYLDGEWVYSNFHEPKGTTSEEFTTHILGDSYYNGSNLESVGLIKSYGDTRAAVQQSEPLMDSDVDVDPLLNLFEDSETMNEIIDDLENDNNSAPYPIMTLGNDSTISDVYPGSTINGPVPVLKREAAIGNYGGVSSPTVMLPGFEALCGLIEIRTQSGISGEPAVDDTFGVVIELAPGNYKGVAAFDI